MDGVGTGFVYRSACSTHVDFKWCWSGWRGFKIEQGMYKQDPFRSVSLSFISSEYLSFHYFPHPCCVLLCCVPGYTKCGREEREVGVGRGVVASLSFL